MWDQTYPRKNLQMYKSIIVPGYLLFSVEDSFILMTFIQFVEIVIVQLEMSGFDIITTDLEFYISCEKIIIRVRIYKN